MNFVSELIKSLFEFLAGFVGLGVVVLFVGFILDLKYLSKWRRFKLAFEKYPFQITNEVVCSKILSKYQKVLDMRNKLDKLSGPMERDLLQGKLEEEWELIREMEAAALINNFPLSKESHSALDEVNRLVVYYVPPLA